jgi:hypothetical protein
MAMESSARRRQEHLEALQTRLREFLLEMYLIDDETDIEDLGNNLSPVTPLTIGDLKILESAVGRELHRIKSEPQERGAA